MNNNSNYNKFFSQRCSILSSNVNPSTRCQQFCCITSYFNTFCHQFLLHNLISVTMWWVSFGMQPQLLNESKSDMLERRPLRLKMSSKLLEIIIVRNLLISLFLKPLLSFKQFFLYLQVELRNVQSIVFTESKIN